MYNGQHEILYNIARDKPHYVNLTEYMRRTPLFVCARFGSIDAIQTLIELGADLDLRDECDVTPLAKAAMNNHSTCVQLLLKHNADYKQTDVMGDNPMFAAVSFDAVESIIILASMCPELIDSINPLTSETCIMRAAEYGCVAALRCLLHYGACVNDRNERGQSALIIACKHGNLECVSLLLNSGAAISELDSEGASAVHWAAVTGQYHILEYLISTVDPLELDINRIDTNGDSPLCKTIRANSLSCMCLLLDSHAVTGGAINCAARLCNWELFDVLVSR